MLYHDEVTVFNSMIIDKSKLLTQCPPEERKTTTEIERLPEGPAGAAVGLVFYGANDPILPPVFLQQPQYHFRH